MNKKKQYENFSSSPLVIESFLSNYSNNSDKQKLEEYYFDNKHIESYVKKLNVADKKIFEQSIINFKSREVLKSTNSHLWESRIISPFCDNYISQNTYDNKETEQNNMPQKSIINKSDSKKDSKRDSKSLIDFGFDFFGCLKSI